MVTRRRYEGTAFQLHLSTGARGDRAQLVRAWLMSSLAST
jgi:hypothetical protein